MSLGDKLVLKILPTHNSSSTVETDQYFKIYFNIGSSSDQI